MPASSDNHTEHSTPTFSVIMPAHDAQETLASAMRSVLDQSYTDLELIVVENGSSDATARVATDVGAKDPRVRVIVDGPCGPAAARNEGIRCARGMWVAFLDADDEYDRAFLSTVADAIAAHHGHEAFAVNGVTIGRPFETITPGLRYRRSFEMDLDSIVDMQLITGQVILRREPLVELGGFDATIPTAEDKNLWIRYFAAHRGIWIPHRLLHYRYERSSLSHSATQRTMLLNSLLNSLALARTHTLSTETIARVERLERHYREQLDAFPRRAALEESLGRGVFSGARGAYLKTRRAYSKQRNWVFGLPVMLLSPRLFARLFVN